MYEFPPRTWYMTGWWPELFHLTVIAFLVTGITRFVRQRKIVRVYDAALIAVATVVCTGLLMFPRGQSWEAPRSAHSVWFLLVWIVAAVATEMNWKQLAAREIPFAIAKSLGLVIPAGFCMTLLVMFFVMFPEAREAARRSNCRGNLKQIGLGLYNYHDYHDVYQSFPPHRSGDPAYSWRVAFLPYIDQKSTYDKYDFQSAWNQGTNEMIARLKIPLFKCPSNRVAVPSDDYPRTDYVAVVGEETFWRTDEPVRIEEITDGTSNTLMVVENCGARIPWCEPRDVEFDDQQMGINLPGDAKFFSSGPISSYHFQQAIVLMADASIRSLSTNTDPQVIRALLTRSSDDDPGEF